MAAGLTIKADAIDAFRAFVIDDIRADYDRAVAGRSRRIDAVVGAGAVSRRVAAEIALAGPYGPGNTEPTFVVPDLRADRLKEVGKGHIAATLVDPHGETLRAIAFRAAGEPLEAVLRSGARLHVAGRIKEDDWGGGASAQLHIIDAAPAA
jgi:single-stranded-DNA-specific exonuclease